jgi:hypothetical protein
MTSFYVGHTVRFTASFTNDGAPYVPANVVLNIVFVESDVPLQREFEMTPDGDGLFSYHWDTEWATPGVVRWDIRNGVAPVAVTAGRFILRASPAAPAPAS